MAEPPQARQPSKAKTPAVKGRAKVVEPYTEIEAAKLVCKVARTGAEPTKAERARLDRSDPLWGEACHQAEDSGLDGIKHFLKWLETSHPDKEESFLAALDAAEELPFDEEVGEDEAHIGRTDLGNARRLVKLFGDRIRFHANWKVWLVHDGRRWKEDLNGQVTRFAKKTVASIYKEAAAARDETTREALAKFAITSESRSRIDNMIALAATEPGIPITRDELDRDPFLFNVLNGTVDLQTGRLRPHRKEDMITKLAPVKYDPDAKCPIFEAFLAKVLDGNAEMIGFLIRALGYALTGDTSEQCLFFLHGDGSNGKSTLLDTIEEIMGDYAITIDPAILMSKETEGHSTELCDLDGPRFVNTEEVEDGKKMAENLVKRLTGGTNKIRARRMRRDPYQFDPRFKLFLAANHQPNIRGTDRGIWRRIRVVPFTVTITEEEKDRELPKKLLKERAGILALLVRGCEEWKETTLRPPPEVLSATEEYRRDQDTIQKFVDQCCVVGPNLRCNTQILYDKYQEWCKRSGIKFPLTKNKLGRELTKKGYATEESNGKSYRKGLDVGGGEPEDTFL